MPDLLLELFSEEIPARMQKQAAEDLRRLVTDGLVEAGLTYEGAKAFVTPRRLALTVHGLTARSADVTEEKKGPRVGAPEKAIEGFLRGAGLTSIDQAKIEKDPKKGDFYVARVTKAGRAAELIIAETVPSVIRDFPWPKSMRWGERSGPQFRQGGFGTGDYGAGEYGTASLRWVRPLRSILCTFGPETEEPIVIDFEVAGIAAGNVTFGHRFLRGGEPIAVRRFDDYQPKLEAAKVVLDHERRQAIIETEAKHLAFAQGLELVEDKGLLEEVAGLVEWPVVLMGSFDEKFLAIPAEVIRLTIRQNQKCFVLRDQKSGKLTNRFLLTSNIEATDGGKEIVAGNQKVIAARLSDARFFWEQDLKVRLEEHAKKLGTITFHEKLGTQAERVERVARLARELSTIVGANPDDAERAARLAKADLTSGMVGEFPELQGVMGRYYALAQGEKPAVADAIRDHYKPQGPNDVVPSEPVSVAVALADKLDTLVGFWAIDEKPTGSKDPYALRRAALGVIRIVLVNQLPMHLFSTAPHQVLLFIIWGWRPDTEHPDLGYRTLIGERPMGKTGVTGGAWHENPYRSLLNFDGLVDRELHPIGLAELSLAGDGDAERGYPALNEIVARLEKLEEIVRHLFFDDYPADVSAIAERVSQPQFFLSFGDCLRRELLSFFADRLEVHLRETGARHDLIDAVFALPGQDDLLMIVLRVEALGKFLDSDDGKNLLIGYRRAANILRAEEKKDGEGAFDAAPDPQLIETKGQAEERALFHVMQAAENHAREHVGREDFEGAMRALAELRPAVDAFFDKVTVNADDPELRKNRLKLLNMLRRATLAVADFSKIGGG